MQRVALLSVAFLLSCVPLAYSGSAHFVSCSVSINDGEICVTGKEAGLGNLDQINLSLSVVAHCQNRGKQDPAAANKETFSDTFQRPVQNGKALYDVCLTPTFSPDCSRSMSIIVDSVSLVDTTHDIGCTLD